MANFMRKCFEIRKSWRVDQSNLKVDRSNFDQCRSIEFNSIDQFFPLIFAAEHAGFVTLVVSSKRGTLEGVRGVILHGFLALISFYKAIAMPPCWRAIHKAVARFNFVHFVVYFSSSFL